MFVVLEALYFMLQTHRTQAACISISSRTIMDPYPPGPGFPQDPPSKYSRNIIPEIRPPGNICIAGGSSTRRRVSSKANLTRANSSLLLFMSDWYMDPLKWVITSKLGLGSGDVCLLRQGRVFYTAGPILPNSMKYRTDGKTSRVPERPRIQ